MFKLKVEKNENHNCCGCLGDTGIDEDCIEVSYRAGVQNLPPCVVSREFQNIIYVEDKEGFIVIDFKNIPSEVLENKCVFQLKSCSGEWVYTEDDSLESILDRIKRGVLLYRYKVVDNE